MNNTLLPVNLSFDIPILSSGISDFLINVLAEIQQSVVLTEKTKGRIKLILIELCTNFIKHVQTNHGKIDIEIGKNAIYISKKYKENSFKQVMDQKIKIDRFGEIVEVHFSDTNNHYVEILETNKLRFLDPFKMGLYSDKLKDHFGLHILTIASDDFMYEYDCEKDEDCFTARIEYV